MNKIYQLLLVGVATLAPSAYGQGFYTTYQVNDPSYDTGFIETDAIGYPGSGPCGSLSMWNELNGFYQSGWAPGDVSDQIFAYDSTDYPWNYGYSYQYQSPYGYCVAASFTFNQCHRIRHHHFTHPLSNAQHDPPRPGRSTLRANNRQHKLHQH